VALTVAALEAAAGAGGREAAEARAAVEELRAGWASDGIEADLGGEAGEVTAVAGKLVAGPYPELGGPLTGLVRFDARRLAAHREDATALLEGRQPATSDARTLLAAAGRAYAQDPQAYRAQGVPDRVLRRVRAVQEPGVREAPQLAPADRSAADARAADELYALLLDG
jgi:hypothetical protein